MQKRKTDQEPPTNWQSPYKCKVCEDIIFSRYQGEFRRCRCGAIAVDQTAHYTRLIGEPSNFIYEKEE